MKKCFCIGPNKCTDITCQLVKDYLKSLKNNIPQFKKRIECGGERLR
jgi:hypothetical protein